MSNPNPMTAQERAMSFSKELDSHGFLHEFSDIGPAAELTLRELHLAEMERVCEQAKRVSDANCIDILAHAPLAMSLMQALTALDEARK
jgi:hypothetical protein